MKFLKLTEIISKDIGNSYLHQTAPLRVNKDLVKFILPIVDKTTPAESRLVIISHAETVDVLETADEIEQMVHEGERVEVSLAKTFILPE